MYPRKSNEAGGQRLRKNKYSQRKSNGREKNRKLVEKKEKKHAHGTEILHNPRTDDGSARSDRLAAAKKNFKKKCKKKRLSKNVAFVRASSTDYPDGRVGVRNQTAAPSRRPVASWSPVRFLRVRAACVRADRRALASARPRGPPTPHRRGYLPYASCRKTRARACRRKTVRRLAVVVIIIIIIIITTIILIILLIISYRNIAVRPYYYYCYY